MNLLTEQPTSVDFRRYLLRVENSVDKTDLRTKDGPKEHPLFGDVLLTVPVTSDAKTSDWDAATMRITVAGPPVPTDQELGTGRFGFVSASIGVTIDRQAERWHIVNKEAGFTVEYLDESMMFNSDNPPRYESEESLCEFVSRTTRFSGTLSIWTSPLTTESGANVRVYADSSISFELDKGNPAPCLV
ncbi:MAG: hypothetical protein IPK16_13645 [Anaerolineales bacterium]|nr:hypothetical protein [Anaerolineales bacterium]